MRRLYSCLKLRLVWICFVFFLFPLVAFTNSARALTASIGQPYHGRLINGVPFPTQFPGYQVREPEHTYTTPEVAGALLDAIGAVLERFPSSCDLYLGDFSPPAGGMFSRHRSHQNGRDVDIGMYAKDNRPLDGLTIMNEENLDVPKTWCLIENILRSQRVQYIFLDRRIQKLLYDYAVSRGADDCYLERLFGNVRGAVIQHVPNHQDHMHVRFFTPWSTLAAHVGEMEDQKRTVIEMAQQSYLPKKVFYYAKGTERGLDALASSFGVTRRDLCRWNQFHGSEVPSPGSCIVFYKRGFELEPVHLAQSLQPDFIAETPAIQVASLRSSRTFSDTPVSLNDSVSPPPREKKEDAPAMTVTYTARKGDTLARIARHHHLSLKVLCEINGMSRSTSLRPGQKIKLATTKLSSTPDTDDAADDDGPTADTPRSGSAKVSQSASVPEIQKPKASAPSTMTIGKGDTLEKIARKSGISVDTLCRLNGLKKNAALKPGQKLALIQAEALPKPLLVASVAALPVPSRLASSKVTPKAVVPAKVVSSAKVVSPTVTKVAPPTKVPSPAKAAASSKTTSASKVALAKPAKVLPAPKAVVARPNSNALATALQKPSAPRHDDSAKTHPAAASSTGKGEKLGGLVKNIKQGSKKVTN